MFAVVTKERTKRGCGVTWKDSSRLLLAALTCTGVDAWTSVLRDRIVLNALHALRPPKEQAPLIRVHCQHLMQRGAPLGLG
jgi:hypothetical protein